MQIDRNFKDHYRYISNGLCNNLIKSVIDSFHVWSVLDGPAKGQGDESRGPGDLSQGLISREISLYANFYGKLLTGNERHLLDEMAKTAGSGHLHHCAGFASQLPVKIACFYSSACCGSAQDHLLVES